MKWEETRERKGGGPSLSHPFFPATPFFSHIKREHFREPSTHASSLVSESLKQAKLMVTEQVVRISELTCKIVLFECDLRFWPEGVW